MKQTAVEWLVNEMVERNFFAKDTPLSYTTLEHLTNQAKAMEKEQIIDAATWGTLHQSAEQYYNETFKSK